MSGLRWLADGVHRDTTPGNRYVIYNSDATGITQVYAAEIPPRLLEDVEAG